MIPSIILSLAMLDPMALCGPQWNALSLDQRDSLVSGMVIGNAWTAGILVYRLDVPLPAARRYLIVFLHPQDIRAYLDSFYALPANARVPIGEAVFQDLAHKPEESP
jgi:hypothetical protein